MISHPQDFHTFTTGDGEDWEMTPDDYAINCTSEIPALIERMNAEQFWPNVWLINERGNTDLLSINCDTGAYSVVYGWV